jgi:GT2 family glycosyltransferase
VVGVEQVVRRPGRVSGVFVLSAGGQFRWALSHGSDYVERLTRDGRVVADGPPGRREVAIQRLRRQPPVEVAAVDALLRDWLATFQGATASGLPTVEDARVCGRLIEEVEAAPMAAAGGSGRSTTVVIPVKDDRRIEQAVASVVALKPSQLIVVNNGSEAEFGEWLRTALPEGVELIEEAVASVYRARNLAVARAAGDVVFFTDADCVVEPGWISAGLEAIADGADLVQGYSGLHGEGRAQHLLQGRYEAHLRKLRRGDGTECDTRNLAVRRSVFDTLTFNEGFRRVGDTEFGLLAEAAGYRVGYEPEMRVAHSHDPDLRLFAAKQVCHGWGAQRLMQDHPEIRWHGGHLQLVSRVSTRLAGFPPSRFLAPLCTWGSLQSARALEFAAPYIPRRLGFLWLTGIDKLAALGGHFAYRPGAEEPSPSRILKRRVPRD